MAKVIAPSAPKLARTAADPPARPALEDDEQAQRDQSYVENTERAVALYRQFIERAGSDPHYAAAVKRSREQIQDLSNTLLFVEQGMAERTGR